MILATLNLSPEFCPVLIFLRCQGAAGSPLGIYQDRVWQLVLSHCPSQKQGSWGDTRAAPVLAIGHLPGDMDRQRLGWDIGTWVGLAHLSPWLGMAGLWGAGDCPCCNAAGAGADGAGGLMGGPGQGGGSPEGRTVWEVRPWQLAVLLLML